MFRRKTSRKNTARPVLGWLRRMRGFGMIDGQGNEGVWLYVDGDDATEFTHYEASDYRLTDKTVHIQ